MNEDAIGGLLKRGLELSARLEQLRGNGGTAEQIAALEADRAEAQQSLAGLFRSAHEAGQGRGR